MVKPTQLKAQGPIVGEGRVSRKCGVPLEKARTYARYPEPMDVYRTGERDQERARDLGPGQEPRLSKQAA